MVVRQVTGNGLRQELQSIPPAKLAVVDFGAKWCGPCKMIEPQFDALSNQYEHVAFLKIDVDESQDDAMDNSVQAMPTFIFFKSGSEVHRIRGADIVGLQNKVQELAGDAAQFVFAGQGRRLGGTVSAVQSCTQTEAERQQTEVAAQSVLDLDPSLPITNIQIRLADGSKLTANINTHHSVVKLRQFILKARAEYASQPFQLMTTSTFPSKVLVDETQSIQDANLCNSVVVQKLT